MNLLILCLDALRDDHVTADIMPYLHGLAESGTRYRGVTCKEAWTLPSVAAMLTGDDDAFSKGSEGMVGRPTLAAMLARTHATGAFIGQPVLATSPELDWIWEDFGDVWTCAQVEEWTQRPRGMQEVWEPFFKWREEQFVVCDPQDSDQAGDYDPWFAYIHLFEVHEPYTTGPILASTPHAVENGYFTYLLDLETGRINATDAEQDELRAAYRVYCRRTDHELAKYLPRVIDQETVVFIVSDHGDSHGEGGVWGHGWGKPYQTEAARTLFWAIIGPHSPQRELSRSEKTNAWLPHLVLAHMLRNQKTEPINTDAVHARLRELGYMGG